MSKTSHVSTRPTFIMSNLSSYLMEIIINIGTNTPTDTCMQSQSVSVRVRSYFRNLKILFIIS